MRAACIATLMLLCASAFAAEPRDEARQHFDAGEAAYKRGDFETAAKEYEASYRLYPHPALLFDLGQTYRRLEQYDRAIESYRQFLRDAPAANPKRREAEQHLAALEKLVGNGSTQQSTPPPRVDEPKVVAPMATPATTAPTSIASLVVREPRRWYRNTIGWSLAGGGVAFAVIGAGLMGEAASLTNAANGAATLPERNSDAANIGPFRWSGVVLLSVGGALTIAGIVVLARSAHR